MRLVLMNSAMMPSEGTYVARKITEEEAKEVVLEHFTRPIESFVGYAETASYMAETLGVGVPVNRGQAELEDEDVILVCKLAYRIQDPAQKGNLKPESKDYEWWVIHYWE